MGDVDLHSSLHPSCMLRQSSLLARTYYLRRTSFSTLAATRLLRTASTSSLSAEHHTRNFWRPGRTDAGIASYSTKATMSAPNGQEVQQQDGQNSAAAVVPSADKTVPAPLNEAGGDASAQSAREAKKKEKELKKAEAIAKAQAKKDAAAKAAQTAGQAGGKAKKDKPAKKEVIVKPFVNNTPAGEKKTLVDIFNEEEGMSTYDPVRVEAAWDLWWEKLGVYKPALTESGEIKPEGVFVVPLPPPNVTGALHIGHALTVAVQDCLTRWNRMQGKTVLYTPGYDHAGISTQSVVEKRLYKATGQTRHDLGREEFLKKVWEWKDQYQQRITKQMRRLGASTDWSRAAFSMDEQRYKAVMENFCRLHEEGIIYRANRLVNWCCHLRTTLSNIECDPKDIKGRELLGNLPGYDPKERFEFGVLTSFAYKIEGSDEKIVVATTRPETMVGDTGIAVHPDDDRYKHLVGKNAVHPFIPSRKIPIVTDSELVDMEFGTGAVKITPAHDPNDFKCGERNNLEFINVLNDDGTMNENAGPFTGMKRYHARNAVLAALKEQDLYIGAEPNAMTLQVCSKSGDIIEQVMKPQWWVSVKPLADAAIAATRAGDLSIKPSQSENDWFRWLEKPQDWCISRQLWWGHRVPAYLVKIKGREAETDDSDEKWWIIAKTKEEAEQKAKAKYPGEEFELSQDDDVLDTWFSAGLWPFSTVGWPDKTFDFERFYPASLLETGWDILFFWVARMVMLGLRLTGKMPFSEVFCHAMIRDAHGRKMSKSLGNVIDPIDVIEGVTLEALHEQLIQGNLEAKELERAKKGQKLDFPNGIPQCGADALRFALCAYTTGGRDINMEILRVEGYRKFCNKLWNATKFAMLKFPEGYTPAKTAEPTGKETLVEQWILSRLENCATLLNKHLESRNFLLATQCVYDFWLYELCDVYIEAMKPLSSDDAPEAVRRSAQDTLYTCLDQGLKMLHPFMPFVTEELWQRLPRRPEDKTVTIALAAFPKTDEKLQNAKAERDFALVNSCTEVARSLAGAYNLRTGLQTYIQCNNPELLPLLKEQTPTVAALVKGSKSVEVVDKLSDVPEGCSSDTVGADVVVHLLIKGLINVDAELTKTQKKITGVSANIDKLSKMVNKAETPEEVRTASAEQLKQLEAELAALNINVEQFNKMK